MGDCYDEPDGLELLEWSKKDVCCGRCQLPVPFEEKELYEETGKCGLCV